MNDFVVVADVDAIPEGAGLRVATAGRHVALFRVNGKVHAIEDRCTHEGARLSEGYLDGTTVLCPWHGASFCLITGRNLSPPAPHPVLRWDVRIEAGKVLLRSA